MCFVEIRVLEAEGTHSVGRVSEPLTVACFCALALGTSLLSQLPSSHLCPLGGQSVYTGQAGEALREGPGPMPQRCPNRPRTPCPGRDWPWWQLLLLGGADRVLIAFPSKGQHPREAQPPETLTIPGDCFLFLGINPRNLRK